VDSRKYTKREEEKRALASWWPQPLRVVRRTLGKAKGVAGLGEGGGEVKGMVMVLVAVMGGGVGGVGF